MTHPYEGLPDAAYWRRGVADVGPYGLNGLWTPKFRIRESDVVVTAGSCFAQHIGQAMLDAGFNWTDFEPAPPFLPDDVQRKYGYGVFSFRTGNIYTPAMLLQWLQLAYGEREDTTEVWRRDDGRVFDPLRPALEPDGFADEVELRAAREATYRAIREAVEGASVFVFTLGLTESWYNAETGFEYALCPGTIAGKFDKDLHLFRNANARRTARDLDHATAFLRDRNQELRVLLTVSPVPLTATASGRHVLNATSYSKSVLRAAAGMVADDARWIDYFPSYEIITHPIFRGMFFAPNMRSVEPAGVRTVMQHFFADHERVFGKSRLRKPRNAQLRPKDGALDIQCEEVMLDAFSR